MNVAAVVTLLLWGSAAAFGLGLVLLVVAVALRKARPTSPPDPLPPPSALPTACGRCGAALPAGALYCPGCGARLT